MNLTQKKKEVRNREKVKLFHKFLEIHSLRSTITTFNLAHHSSTDSSAVREPVAVHQTYRRTDFLTAKDHPWRLSAAFESLSDQRHRRDQRRQLEMTGMDCWPSSVSPPLTAIIELAKEKRQIIESWEIFGAYMMIEFKHQTLNWFMAASSSAKSWAFKFSSMPLECESNLVDAAAAPNDELVEERV